MTDHEPDEAGPALEAPAPETPAPERSPEWRRARRLTVACAVLFALTAALAVVAATLYARLDEERNRTDEVERVAGQFAAAVASYDYRNLDTAKRDVLALSTGAFRKDYEAKFGDLKTVLEATKASSTTTVKEVYLGPVEGDQATAFVVVDLEVQGSSGRRQLVNEYLELSLVRVRAGWRVDNVRNLNLGRLVQAGSGPGGTPATSTTVPGGTPTPPPSG